jgi:hypothetical protein
MADDRRIIMKTRLMSQEGNTMEGGVTRKWILTGPGILGSNTINTDIATTQTDNNWYKGDNKGTEVTFTGAYQLRDSNNADTLKFLYIKNLNTSGGATFEVSLAAEGEWDDADANSGNLTWNTTVTDGTIRNGGMWNPDYYLRIKPGSSIMLRGDGTTKADAVHVYASTESKIEFIIAK